MPDRPIRHHEVHGIHRVILDDGANALDLPLMAAVRDAVADLRDHGAPPLMLASSHPVLFCPGWDLKQLAAADRGSVQATLRSLTASSSRSSPTPGRPPPRSPATRWPHHFPGSLRIPESPHDGRSDHRRGPAHDRRNRSR